MATKAYMDGRKKYARPQAMLWSDNPGTLIAAPTQDNPDNKIYVPTGYEIGANTGSEANTALFDEFLILTDDNRSKIDFKPTRIETRKRMINGRMRSYHIADKMQITVSWDMIPSRSFAMSPNFNSNGKSDMSGNFGSSSSVDQQYTTDGGAGGAELLDWYNNHQGSFWVFLSYDNYPNFGKDDSSYGHLGQYSEVMEVFFSDFSYNIVKRGSSNYDFWNVSVTLEEA
jgi:hypothetical protein